MSDYPTDFRYTKDHEWGNATGRRVRVGITRHAVDQLGDITLVNIDAKVGANVEIGKAFGTVESVKAVSDLYAPVNGKIAEINESLTNNPEFVNEEPYGKGWMVVIEVTGDLPTDLMDSAAYAKYVASLDH